ncbi:hypothetical protein PIB30_018780 [Stylosanthes scabra]|uniref:Uncharacterized protein n=1 Tax=Stylosanthes scabra TaxID=79078 RepID=A0ABU6Q7W3_9FABA|nr:hypothetical protein [Stylosanthes scabra]
MAEPRGTDSREVVREAEVAQMPHELNPLYSWVTRESGCSGESFNYNGGASDGAEELRGYLWWKRGREAIPSRTSSPGGEGVRIEFGTSSCSSLVVGEQGYVHRIWSSYTFLSLPPAVAPMLLRRSVPIPSERLVGDSVFRIGDGISGASSGSRCVPIPLYGLLSDAEGKSKKGYMLVRPGKNRKIFGLYEESFHDFKGRYFKVFLVGDHHPFWLTLERDAVKMAGKNKTLARLRQVMQANPQGLIVLSPSGGQVSSSAHEGGGGALPRMLAVGPNRRIQLEVSSPIREEGPEPQTEVPSSSPSRKRGPDEATWGRVTPPLYTRGESDYLGIRLVLDGVSDISRLIVWQYKSDNRSMELQLLRVEIS